MGTLIIGSRGSQLALWQANFIKHKIESSSDTAVEIKTIKTQGDKITDLSFDKMEGKGFFTKEIEDALLDDSIDLAVHSLKDLQTTMPPGLALTAVGFREDSREAILVRSSSYDSSKTLGIIENGIIGSSSVRRQSQIAQLRPDLQLKDLRGNVPTRIKKLRDGNYDGIVLAYAGLKRLEVELSGLELLLMEKDVFIPAPGQGILGLQTREEDKAAKSVVGLLEDAEARVQVNLERGLLGRFDGGCQLPLGAYSEITDTIYRLHSILGIQVDGRWGQVTRAEVTGTDVAEIVEESYKKLISR